MKPHPRIRKTVKWGGAVVSVILVVVWGESAWWGAGWCSTSDFHADVSNGMFGLGYQKGLWPIPEHNVAAWDAARPHLDWKPWWDTGPTNWSVRIPLWSVAVPSSLCAALAWRLDTLARRRARTGFCPKCSYNRAGLTPGAVCPECGSAAPVSAALRTKGI